MLVCCPLGHYSCIFKYSLKLGELTSAYLTS